MTLDPRVIAPALLAWFDTHRRTHLPWREDPTPYHVWVSEIMLQQTRVETVIPYYERFMKALPTVQDLARCGEERLLKLWEGLGYYSRVRNLQRAAQEVVQTSGGTLPREVKALRRLPGIGPYTAGAIASIAYGEACIAPDGNAYRIAARLVREGGVLESASTKKRLEAFLQAALSKDRPGDFNQALMDLGSGICLGNGKPLCGKCPLQEVCAANEEGDPERFPQRKPKKDRRVEQRTVLTVWRGSRLLLRRRPEKGLLAGLWELPNALGEHSRTEVAQWAQARGLGPVFIADLGERTHIFSHIEWRMRGFLVLADVRAEEAEVVYQPASAVERWVSVEELQQDLSIPSAFSGFVVERPLPFSKGEGQEEEE